MKNFAQTLTDAEIDTLNAQLATIKGGKIPNVEALDGFFAALACCPDFVLLSEYMPIIQQGATEDDDLVLDDLDEAKTFIELVSRHWNHVVRQLRDGPVYTPLLLEYEGEEAFGNDWANGFLTGTGLRHAIWAELLQDEARSSLLVPIWALAYEHHPDPDMRPWQHNVTREQREDLIVAAAASTMLLYRHFLPQRDTYDLKGGTFQRTAAKPGRNDPCTCGSGKKHKLCCGRLRVIQ